MNKLPLLRLRFSVFAILACFAGMAVSSSASEPSPRPNESKEDRGLTPEQMLKRRMPNKGASVTAPQRAKGYQYGITPQEMAAIEAKLKAISASDAEIKNIDRSNRPDRKHRMSALHKKVKNLSPSLQSAWLRYDKKAKEIQSLIDENAEKLAKNKKGNPRSKSSR